MDTPIQVQSADGEIGLMPLTAITKEYSTSYITEDGRYGIQVQTADGETVLCQVIPVQYGEYGVLVQDPASGYYPCIQVQTADGEISLAHPQYGTQTTDSIQAYDNWDDARDYANTSPFRITPIVPSSIGFWRPQEVGQNAMFSYDVLNGGCSVLRGKRKATMLGFDAPFISLSYRNYALLGSTTEDVTVFYSDADTDVSSDMFEWSVLDVVELETTTLGQVKTLTIDASTINNRPWVYLAAIANKDIEDSLGWTIENDSRDMFGFIEVIEDPS